MEQFVRKRRKKGERKETCSKCGKPVEESRLGQRYCKDCHADYMRNNRPIHSALKPEAQRRANCRSYANVYIRRGHIQKQPCEICGEFAQMHHEDYSKPLQIRWFCRKHHLELHHDKKHERT